MQWCYQLVSVVVAWRSAATTATSFAAMFSASTQMTARRRTHFCLRGATLPHGFDCNAIINDCEDEEVPAVRLFFRFSPLIGGPSFLPLHVEVIVVLGVGNFGNDDHHPYDSASKKRNDAVYFAMNGDDLSSSVAEFLSTTTDAQGRRRTIRIEEMHRFDYIPMNPTDPTTLVRLLTLQGVPGQIRHRRIVVKDRYSSCSLSVESHDIIGTTTTTGGKKRDKGVEILLPVGCVSGYVDVISTAMKYVDEYHEQLYAELRIVGGKNCLSFALDLLSYVKSAHLYR